MTGPDYFLYLNNSQCYQVDGIDDRQDWAETIQAMNTMAIPPQYQQEIFRLLAAILYLGNVTFAVNGKDEARIADPQGFFTF